MNILFHFVMLASILYCRASSIDCTIDPDSCPAGKRCEQKCSMGGPCTNKCRKFSCGESEFMCQNKKECIDVTKHCDDIVDCEDGTDEETCPFSCEKGTFTCLENERCIPHFFVCDGYSDCGVTDTSDEDNCNLCRAEWQVIYSANTGTKQALIDAVLAGAEVKIMWKHFVDFLTVQNVWVSDGEVYAQALLALRFARYDTFSSSNQQRMMLTVSTTGQTQLLNFNYQTWQTVGSTLTIPSTTVSFYVRKSFSVSDRNLESRWESTRQVLVDGSRLYQLDGIKANVTDHSGTSAWEHVDDNGNVQKIFRLFSSDGMLVTSKWEYNSQTSAGAQTSSPSLEWFINPCWRQVFKQSVLDGDVEGSRDDLRQAIERGNRIVVVVNGKASKATSLRINGNEVIAQMADTLYTDDVSAFKTDAAWEWCEVSTLGTMSCVNHDVSGPERNGDPVTTDVDVEWYFEVRTWEYTYGFNTPENTDSTAMGMAKQGILAGNDVRVMIELDGNDVYYDTVNVNAPDNLPIFAALLSYEFVSDFGTGSTDKLRFIRVHSAGTADILEFPAGQASVATRHDYVTGVTMKWFLAK